MAKIVLVGAGSHKFAQNIITGILSYPEFRDSTLALVDVDKERLDIMTAFAKKLVEQNGFNTQIESTSNRREVLEGADYVLTAIVAGGWRLAKYDQKVTLKYGLEWDDTMGPGGVFFGLRQIQDILDICYDMEKLCPEAWFISYSDPMAMIGWAVNDYTHIKNIGICPNQHGLAVELARYAGVPFDEISYWLAGITHFSWYVEFKWRGEDAYPRLREKFRGDVCSWPDAGSRYDPALGHQVGFDLVAVEIFKRFGYFTNGTSCDLAKYSPYFMKKNRPELLKKFKIDSEAGILEEWAKGRKETDRKLKQQLNDNYKFPINRNLPYLGDANSSAIIHSIETGVPRRINCNVKNNGLITNLSEGCCVEVPCLVDNEGIHPCHVGDLPPQCAALIRPNINVQELAVKGIVERDKTKIFQSILLDPLTSSLLSIDEIEHMVDELFHADTKYLEGFK